MLCEVQNVRQVKGDFRRRWFSDPDHELIVWYQGDEMWGFQFCYDTDKNPRALTWTKEGALRHQLFDNGEGGLGIHKMTPVLGEDIPFDVHSVAARFEKVARDLPVEVRLFVHSKLEH